MKKTLVILSADGLPLRFMNLTNGYASFKKRTEIASCVPVTTGHKCWGDRCLKVLPTSEAMGKHITDLFSRSRVPIGQENESRLAQLQT